MALLSQVSKGKASMQVICIALLFFLDISAAAGFGNRAFPPCTRVLLEVCIRLRIQECSLQAPSPQNQTIPWLCPLLPLVLLLWCLCCLPFNLSPSVPLLILERIVL